MAKTKSGKIPIVQKGKGPSVKKIKHNSPFQLFAPTEPTPGKGPYRSIFRPGRRAPKTKLNPLPGKYV